MEDEVIRVVKSPNRPVQINRDTYALIMHLLRQAEDKLLLAQTVDTDADTLALALARAGLRQAIVTLRAEAEAGQ